MEWAAGGTLLVLGTGILQARDTKLGREREGVNRGGGSEDERGKGGGYGVEVGSEGGHWRGVENGSAGCGGGKGWKDLGNL